MSGSERDDELPLRRGRQDIGTGRRHYDPPDPQTTPKEQPWQRRRQDSGDFDGDDGGSRWRHDNRWTSGGLYDDDDAGQGVGDNERRPPRDASFTAEGRGVYRLPQSPTVDDADDHIGAGSLTAAQEEELELSWNGNGGGRNRQASKSTHHRQV